MSSSAPGDLHFLTDNSIFYYLESPTVKLVIELARRRVVLFKRYCVCYLCVDGSYS